MKELNILGILGEIGGGKGTAARYLHSKYDFHIISMGDMVRAEAAEKGIEKTRENLQKLSMDLRAKYGQDYFCRKALDRIYKQKIGRALIDGIRSIVEYDFWKKNIPNFILVHIYADSKVRFERLKKRGGPRAPKTWNDFLEHEKGEDKLYPGSYSSFLALAKYKVDNSADEKTLYSRLDSLMQKLRLSPKNA